MELSANQVLGGFESLINCDQGTTPWAFDIYKISSADLMGKDTFEGSYAKMGAWLTELGG